MTDQPTADTTRAPGGVASLVSRLVEFGASPEQVEHELREAGLRDPDEPAAAPYIFVSGQIIPTNEEWNRA